MKRLALAASVAITACHDSTPVAAPAGGAADAAYVVDAGALKLSVAPGPWRMTFHDAAGAVVLQEDTATGLGPGGTLGLHRGPPPDGAGALPLLPPLVMGQPAAPPARDTGWA